MSNIMQLIQDTALTDAIQNKIKHFAKLNADTMIAASIIKSVQEN
jgi:hypothetical protein